MKKKKEQNKESIFDKADVKRTYSDVISDQNRLLKLRNLGEVHVLTVLYTCTFAAFLVLGLSILTTYGVQAIAGLEAWSLVLLMLFLVLSITVVLTIWRQPQNQQKVAFMVCVLRIKDPKY